jgi:hypothetical protein
MRTLLLILCGGLLTLGGGCKDQTPESSNVSGPEGSCGPEVGAEGTALVQPLGAVDILEEVKTQAQHQGAIPQLPLFAEEVGGLRSNRCGQVGLLLRKPDGLTYVDITAGATPGEKISAEALGENATLLYDQACTPLIVHYLSGEGYRQFRRTGEKNWQKEVMPLPWDTLLGAAPLNYKHLFGEATADNTLHLFGTGRTSKGPFLLHGTRALSPPGLAWNFALLPPLAVTTLHQIRADASGGVHAVFDRTQYPCDPCNLDLYYAKLSASASWSQELVQASQWGAPHDEFAKFPSLALGPEGEPLIAASYQVRVTTGSLVSSQLRFYRRAQGKWCIETVAVENDGYQGEDGPRFTGDVPKLFLDATGGIHLLFHDLAQWHDKNGYANSTSGQVRYAVRVGKSWQLFTLFPQQGHLKSPKPLQSFDLSQITLDVSGKNIYVVGLERLWQTDSIYNTSEAALTLKATLIRAQLLRP